MCPLTTFKDDFLFKIDKVSTQYSLLLRFCKLFIKIQSKQPSLLKKFEADAALQIKTITKGN